MKGTSLRRFTRLLVLFSLIASLVFSASSALAAAFTTIVDDGGVDTHDVGQQLSMVLDSSGNPVISYLDGDNWDLLLAHCDDPLCASVSINVVEAGVGAWYTSLALDSSGNPVISYMDSNDAVLKLAHCVDPDCNSPASIEVVDDGGLDGDTVGGYTSLALDSSGNPVISYVNFTDDAVMLAYCDDPNCEDAELNQLESSAGDGFGITSLALDSSGNPVIAYIDRGPDPDILRLAQCADPTCSGSNISTLNMNETNYPSLALDSSDRPYVSYFSNENLYIAYCPVADCGTIFNNLLVDHATNEVGSFTSLELDSSGNPVIAHQDSSNGDLLLLRCPDTDCLGVLEESILDDSSDYVGAYASLALDILGNPVVAYYDSSNGNLLLARDVVPATGPICYVDIDATGLGQGSSWEHAYTNPHDALNNDNCTEIWVAEGTYKPHPTDRDFSFSLKSGVELYGGFAGTEDDRDDRDWETHVTILSGDVGTGGVHTDNSYHVVYADGVDDTAALDGFTIQHGYAFNGLESNLPPNRGGGIYLAESSLTLRNLVLRDNFSYHDGGGLANQDGSPFLQDILFLENESSGGGGMSSDGSGHPELNRVVFEKNQAENGGGLGINLNSLLTITDGVFYDNHSLTDGGGIANYGTIYLTNVLFENNVANYAEFTRTGGGGLSVHNEANASLGNVTFSGNQVLGSEGMGGGLFFQQSFPGSTVVTLVDLNNVTFTGNSAAIGGAFAFDALSLFSANTIEVKNSILWGNGAQEVFGEHFDNNVLSVEDSIVAGGCPQLGDTFGGFHLAACTNVLDEDPLLDPLQDNDGFSKTHALAATSPAVDSAGEENACRDIDQRGVLRPQGAGCDMGAYELLQALFNGDPDPPGPLNFDGLPGSSPQLTIEVRNMGMIGSLLDVTLDDISDGYSIISGLPIEDLEIIDPAVTITVQCDGTPQPDGTLTLTTSDPSQLSVTYDLTCADLQPLYEGAPAGGSSLAFSALAGQPAQQTIEIGNGGDAGSQLDVSLSSISTGYSIVSGLPIADLETTGGTLEVVVQCDSAPQLAGTLELITSDPSQPTVTYNLTCTTFVEGVDEPVAEDGPTSGQLGRIWVSLPEGAVPPGNEECRLVVEQHGTSGSFGFSPADTVWDVKVICSGVEVKLLFLPITVCIQPLDGVLANKQVYHNHSAAGFNPIVGGSGPAGFVCGQTRVLSLFTLGQVGLPSTGFAPGRISALPQQPAELAYEASDLTLSIPKLGVQLSIVGVPETANGWDVTWLSSSQAGYLYGTSYPTWQGNSVLTAHVWNADNTPGPFHQLRSLQHGDRFTVTVGGVKYVYEVRSNQLVAAGSLSVLRDSKYSVITLITCEGFNEATGLYRYRRAVQAVLVEVD